jgi:hypothetical protein
MPIANAKAKMPMWQKGEVGFAGCDCELRRCCEFYTTEAHHGVSRLLFLSVFFCQKREIQILTGKTFPIRTQTAAATI